METNIPPSDPFFRSRNRPVFISTIFRLKKRVFTEFPLEMIHFFWFSFSRGNERTGPSRSDLLLPSFQSRPITELLKRLTFLGFTFFRRLPRFSSFSSTATRLFSAFSLIVVTTFFPRPPQILFSAKFVVLPSFIVISFFGRNRFKGQRLWQSTIVPGFYLIIFYHQLLHTFRFSTLFTEFDFETDRVILSRGTARPFYGQRLSAHAICCRRWRQSSGVTEFVPGYFFTTISRKTTVDVFIDRDDRHRAMWRRRKRGIRRFFSFSHSSLPTETEKELVIYGSCRRS